MYPTYNPYEMMDNNNDYYDNNNNNFDNFNDDFPFGMGMQGMPQMGQQGFMMPPMDQQPSFGMGGMSPMGQQPSFGVEATPQFTQTGGMMGTPPQFGQSPSFGAPPFRPPFMFPPTNIAFGLSRCLNRVTLLTLIGNNTIWYFPTSIQGSNLFGFRWSLRGWVRDVIPMSTIISFRCRN